jgi:transcription antitermination protein NusB
MISRRLLRIKVLQVLYAYYTSEPKDLGNSEKELHFSINKAFELYNYLLILILDVSRYAEFRIEIAKNKKIPAYTDLNPNVRFIQNKLIEQIRNNNQLNKYVNSEHISWIKYPELIKKLFNNLTESDIYHNYMNKENSDYQDDKKIVSDFYTEILLPDDFFHIILEEQSIYWNDDLDFVVSMIQKTIKRFNENDGPEKGLLKLYKSKEDKDFIVDLFRKSVSMRSLCLKLIKETANNWDLERIAIMDILVMQLAITEFLEFSSIPTKVTLNEYLEIAKYYSTEKSNIFINGVLDKILTQMKAENKINKKGRGLIGEVK